MISKFDFLFGSRFSRRRLVGAAVALLASCAAWAETDAAKLAQEAMAVIAAERPGTSVAPTPGSSDCLEARWAGGGPLRMCFDNMARFLAGAPEADRRREILKKWDAAVVGARETLTFAEASARLRLQFAPPEIFQEAGTKAPPTRPFSGQLAIVLAIDAPDNYSYATADQIAQWGVGEPEIFARALANLDADPGAPPVEAQSGAGGRYATFPSQDGYMAARLLSPSFRGKLRAGLGDRAFCMIPNRDFLVCWTPDFAKGPAFRAQALKDFRTYSHPRSTELFVVDASGVRPADANELASQNR